MSVNTSAGTTLSISASNPATFDLAGYEASLISSSLVVIGEIVSISEHGRTYQIVNHLPLSTRGVRKFKGSFDEGDLTIAYARDSDDAGQILAKLARNSDNDYTFRIALPGGDSEYFQGKVTAMTGGMAGSDSVVAGSITIAITTTSAGVGIVDALAA